MVSLEPSKQKRYYSRKDKKPVPKKSKSKSKKMPAFKLSASDIPALPQSKSLSPNKKKGVKKTQNKRGVAA